MRHIAQDLADVRLNPLPTAARRALAWLKAALTAMARRREAREAYRHLMAMSDHQLKDIGIARGDVRARVLGDLPETTSHDPAERPAARFIRTGEDTPAHANQNLDEERRVS